jgi:hypothetical protein
MRTFKITNEEGRPVFLLNPVVSFIGMAILWGLSIWCMVDPENSSAILIDGRYRLTKMFTWFYVGTNPAFMVSFVPSEDDGNDSDTVRNGSHFHPSLVLYHLCGRSFR